MKTFKKWILFLVLFSGLRIFLQLLFVCLEMMFIDNSHASVINLPHYCELPAAFIALTISLLWMCDYGKKQSESSDGNNKEDDAVDSKKPTREDYIMLAMSVVAIAIVCCYKLRLFEI